MTNAEWMVKNGYKFSDLDIEDRGNEFKIYLKSDAIGQYPQGFTMYEAAMKWLDMEHKEPILDDEERAYLSAVIKPFRERVWYIRKAVADDTSVYKCSYYILIRFNDGTDDMKFPVFHESNMYKGMGTARTYTPKDLGL